VLQLGPLLLVDAAALLLAAALLAVVVEEMEGAGSGRPRLPRGR
jgi:hypothetical protein